MVSLDLPLVQCFLPPYPSSTVPLLGSVKVPLRRLPSLPAIQYLVQVPFHIKGRVVQFLSFFVRSSLFFISANFFFFFSTHHPSHQFVLGCFKIPNLCLRVLIPICREGYLSWSEYRGVLSYTPITDTLYLYLLSTTKPNP